MTLTMGQVFLSEFFGTFILILLGALLWQSDSDITPAPTSNPIGLPR